MKKITLHSYLTSIAKDLKKLASKVRWEDVVAAVTAFPLAEALQKEAEKIGLKKAAKWAVKVATAPDEQASLLDEWREGSLLDPEGARIARATAKVEIYDWKIKEVTKSITRFTHVRTKLIRERKELIDSLKEITEDQGPDHG